MKYDISICMSASLLCHTDLIRLHLELYMDIFGIAPTVGFTTVEGLIEPSLTRLHIKSDEYIASLMVCR